MKKIMSMLIIILLAVSLTSCKNKYNFDAGTKVNKISFKSISGEEVTVDSKMSFEEVMEKIGYDTRIESYFRSELTYRNYDYYEVKNRMEEYEDGFKDDLTIKDYITSYEDNIKYVEMSKVHAYDYNPQKYSNVEVKMTHLYVSKTIDSSTISSSPGNIDEPFNVLDCCMYSSPKQSVVGYFSKDIISISDRREFFDYQVSYDDYTDYDDKIPFNFTFQLPKYYDDVLDFDPYDYYDYKYTLTNKYIIIEIDMNFPIEVAILPIYFNNTYQANQIKKSSDVGTTSKMIIALDYKNNPLFEGKNTLPTMYYYIERIDDLEVYSDSYVKLIREKAAINSVKNKYDEFIEYCKNNQNS